MPDLQKYTNKLVGARVLITGGTSGIGYSVAEACIEHGCIVHVASSTPEKVATAVQKLIASYPSAEKRVHGHICSLSDKDTIESNIAELLAKTGELDHIVHTAGDIPPVPTSPDGKTGMHAVTVDDSIGVSMVRLFAAQVLAKHAVSKLPRSIKSSFTITSGAQSDRPIPGYSWATGAAAGIHGLARGLAVDMAPVRVNCVSPGTVETPITHRFPAEHKEAIFESLRQRTLLKSIAQPEDTAEAYLYLMKDSSCTGSVIRNDGGALLA